MLAEATGISLNVAVTVTLDAGKVKTQLVKP
jgi:hypothetical protein